MANIVLSAGADNTIALWDIRTNKSIFRILAHPEPITSIDISDDSTLISSSSYDCYVRFWDMLKGQCLKTMMADAGSKDPISFCKMTPFNSEYLLFGSMNSSLGLYNYQNDLLKEYKGHMNESYQIDALFVRNKKTKKYVILCGSEDGFLYGWDLNSQRL
jgi:WD40 repeat protein